MIRTKGEPGTGNIVEAVRHIRMVMDEIRKLKNMPSEELMSQSKESGAPYELLRKVAKEGKLPVVNFCRRRNCYPCRCCPNDAAGFRWCICRFGNI